MNKKLGTLLFEENNISNIFENTDGEISNNPENTKGISYADATNLSKKIANKLKTFSITDQKAQEELSNLSDNQIKDLNSAGKLGNNISVLKRISNISIEGGFKLNPLQISRKGVEQQIGAVAKDLPVYAKRGVVPFTVYDKNGQEIAAEKNGKSYPYVYFWAIPGALADKESVQFLNLVSGNQEIKTGEIITVSNKLGFMPVDPEEIDKIIQAFSSNNVSLLKSIDTKGQQRKGQRESIEIVKSSLTENLGGGEVETASTTSPDPDDADAENTGSSQEEVSEEAEETIDLKDQNEKFKDSLEPLVRDYNKVAEEVNAELVEEDSDVLGGYGSALGGLVGAGMGITAGVATIGTMGIFGALLAGPAVLAGTTLVATGKGAAFGAVAEKGLTKFINKSKKDKAADEAKKKTAENLENVTNNIRKEVNTISKGILKLIEKALQNESFIYSGGLGLLLEQENDEVEESEETKEPKIIKWTEIEKILNNSKAGPYKNIGKGGQVDEDTLGEIAEFSSRIVKLIEENFSNIKVEGLEYKGFDLNSSLKKREERAKNNPSINANAKEGEAVNPALEALINGMLTQNIPSDFKNILLVLKILNLLGGKKLGGLPQDVLVALLNSAKSNEDFNIVEEVPKAFDIPQSTVSELTDGLLTEEKLSKLSEEQIQKLMAPELVLLGEDHQSKLRNLIDDLNNLLGLNITPNIIFDQRAQDYLILSKNFYSDKKLSEDTLNINKKLNPLTCYIHSLFSNNENEFGGKQFIDYLINKQDQKVSINNDDKNKAINLINRFIEESEKDIVKSLESKFGSDNLGKDINLSSDSVPQGFKQVFLDNNNDDENSGEANDSSVDQPEKTEESIQTLKDKNVLREEWLRIWEIEK